MSRLSVEEMMVSITKIVAQRGTCKRAKVGCVIELSGRILSIGYNGSKPGDPHCLDVGCLMVGGHCVRTTHAEANAIAWAARRGISTDGARLFVYGWEGGVCPTCLKLVEAAGIIDIVRIPLEAE